MLRESPPLPFVVQRRIAIVDLISVRQDQRGSGMGRALMAAAEGWARSMGADTVELNVFMLNQNAIHLYEALGYAPISQRMVKKME